MLQLINYDEIDFSEPVGGDTIATRDEEERYFDDQEPSRPSNERTQRRIIENGDAAQNGSGEYDY